MTPGAGKQHQQRCETCRNCEPVPEERRFTGQLPYCNEGDYSITPDMEDRIRRLGCASHSSAAAPAAGYYCGWKGGMCDRPLPASSPASSEPEPTRQELIDFARWTQTFWKHGIEIMRSNGLIIKSDEPMEKLAFTFYTNLCEIDREVQRLFQEGYKDENYKNESAVESQTIKSYPKPYEQRIASEAAAAERKRVLKCAIVELVTLQNNVSTGFYKTPTDVFEQTGKIIVRLESLRRGEGGGQPQEQRK